MLTLHGIPNCETVKKARAWPYRKLDAALTHDLDARKAVALMIEYPSSIRRPTPITCPADER